jgi:hypothetical protein
MKIFLPFLQLCGLAFLVLLIASFIRGLVGKRQTSLSKPSKPFNIIGPLVLPEPDDDRWICAQRGGQFWYILDKVSIAMSSVWGCNFIMIGDYKLSSILPGMTEVSTLENRYAIEVAKACKLNGKPIANEDPARLQAAIDKLSAINSRAKSSKDGSL